MADTGPGRPPPLGKALAEEVKNSWPETDVVMMTDQPGLETDIPSLKTGAFDHLIKPFPNEQLAAVGHRASGFTAVRSGW